MSPWECRSDEHFLFGMLTVQAVDAATGAPVSVFWMGVAHTPEVAAGKG
jgi:hypothetical protein